MAQSTTLPLPSCSHLMVSRESPLFLTKDIMASMMAMNPASACSLPCAVNTGRPAVSIDRFDNWSLLHVMCVRKHFP
jgi:hypothetical protein